LATARAPSVTGRAPIGLQRRQARNPARSASTAVGKNDTWPRRGRRLGQVGRQKTPVLFTA
jgi:hypothetical protein